MSGFPSSRRRVGIAPRSDVFRVLYEGSTFVEMNHFCSELKQNLPAETQYAVSKQAAGERSDTVSYDIVLSLPIRYRIVDVQRCFGGFRDGGKLSTVKPRGGYERRAVFLGKHLGELDRSELDGDLVLKAEVVESLDGSCTETCELESSYGERGFPRKRSSYMDFVDAYGSESPGKKMRYNDVVLQKAEELKRKEVGLLRLQLYRLSLQSGSTEGMDDMVRRVCAGELSVESSLDEEAKREGGAEVTVETT
jgi:hypothetical protein